MLTVGDAVPDFRLPALAATVGHGWELDSAWLRGRWLALLYWPRHSCLETLTDVTELVSISSAFTEKDTQFVAACGGLDLDRRAGRPAHLSSEMPFPVVVDVRGELAARLGIERTLQGGGRATFVADPAGLVRFTSATDLSPLRSLREAAGVLTALRSPSPPASDAPPARTLIRACAWCRRMEDDAGWHTPEAFIRRRTGSDLTHGICTECLQDQSRR